MLPEAREALDAITGPSFSKIMRRLGALRDFPDMGSPMFGPYTGYRSLVVGFYRIVYRALPNQVEVAYIRDFRRRPLA